MSAELLERVRERLVDHPGPINPAAVADAIRAETGGVLGDTDLLTALRVLQTELTGAGPLDPLLDEPEVTDILVTEPNKVWIDRGKGLEIADVTFPDEGSVRRLAQRLALAAGRRLDEAQPWVDGQLTAVGSGEFGVRLHAVLPPVAALGTCLSLRVLRPATQGLAALINLGAIPTQIARLIDAVIKARLAFLVTGGTGAGKTTLLAALLGEVAHSERIICVEDAPELLPQHPHVVHLVARMSNIEGAGEVTVRQLVRQALRMRPDRIVVGEVRGAEVVDLLTALNTGHEGGAGTLHANSPNEVPARLEALAALGGIDRKSLHSQLFAAIKVVIHMQRSQQGYRCINEISILRRGKNEFVSACSAWTFDNGYGPGWSLLADLLASHGINCAELELWK
ncbi:MAG: TadA family conjugal transfer-associated ATPase [Mycobacteriaceae bacterium]